MAREKPAAAAVTVHPVEGAWLPGVPAVPQQADPEAAAALVASGAFAYPKPEDRPEAAPADPQED